MEYREIGKKFCDEINSLLKTEKIKAAFVTGGGYAYDSIKYSQEGKTGDFDFMIIYDSKEDIEKILEILSTSSFDYEKKYLSIDKDLLKEDKIDTIRLSGSYNGIKSTINLVPKSIVERICNFERELIIRKVAHNRNTSLFFAYGSDNSRITVNFISPSFITEDNEDHYIHLDFSMIEQENNIYLGILADAILKGFNNNYDEIGFTELRQLFIYNIYNYFKNHKIDSRNYLNLFSNNVYFPEYLKEQLLSEFNKKGVLVGEQSKPKKHIPIVFSIDFDIDYNQKPFNFINNKEYQMNFEQYIQKMQNNEYDRQYLIDALGKFLGYLMCSKTGEKKYDKNNIINEIQVYGTNDLYLPNVEEYDLISIIDAIIYGIKNNINNYNYELAKEFLIICTKFLSQITSTNIDEILKKQNISTSILNPRLNSDTMQINIIRGLNTFNEIGTYHNYTSRVMPSYSKQEAQFLKAQILNKEANILDIMCGYGRLANELKLLGYEKITGIDTDDYLFLGVPKDFKFIQDDYLKHIFTEQYDFLYSLYNCYENNDYLANILEKSHSILLSNGKMVIDCFNKSWRDSIDRKFYKELYVDDNYKLIIRRDYDNQTGIETTIYELYSGSKIEKEYTFVQKFFNLKDLYDVLGDKWICTLNDSSDLQTRTNSQKHILVLEKK